MTEVIRTCPTSGAGCIARSRYLLLGFAGAFQRSALVALDVADLQCISASVVVTVRRSKTDQQGAGVTKAAGPVPCDVSGTGATRLDRSR